MRNCKFRRFLLPILAKMEKIINIYEYANQFFSFLFFFYVFLNFIQKDNALAVIWKKNVVL